MSRLPLEDYYLLTAKKLLRLHAADVSEITMYGVPISNLDKEDLINLVKIQTKELQIYRERSK